MTKKIIITLLFVFLILGCTNSNKYQTKYRAYMSSPTWFDISSNLPFVSNDWLIKQLTLEQVSEEFGFNSNDVSERWKNIWTKFKSTLKEGDEIWWFISTKKSWQELNGVKGYTILRNGKSIAGFVTGIN